MAKISIIQSEQRLISESPRARVSPSAFGQEGRNIAAVGEAISKTHDIIRTAYDFQQTGEAKLKTLEAHAAILAQVEQDGDNTGDYTQVDSEFDRSDEILSGIRNPAARAKYKLEHDLSKAQTRAKVTGIFREHMVSKGKANLAETNLQFIEEYAKTGDPDLIKYKDLDVDTYVKEGFIKAEVAQKLKTETTDMAKYNNFLNEIDTPGTEEKLETNAYGMNTKDLNKAKTVYKTARAGLQNGHQEELDQLYYVDKLNEETIDTYVRNKWITPKSGTAYKKSLDKLIADNPDPFIYNSMLERAAQVSKIGGWWFPSEEQLTKRFNEAAKLRVDIMNEVGKNLAKAEAGEILKKMGKSFDDFQPYKDGILELESFTNTNSTPQERDEIKQVLYKHFMRLVESGTDPVVAIRKAKADLFPEYKLEDLEFTAKETGITIKQVYDILRKQGKTK